MASFKIFDENEDISPAIFILPKPPKEVSKLNVPGKLRSKSDPSTPIGLRHINNENSETFHSSEKMLLRTVRTPLQTLNKNVLKSERTGNKAINTSERRNISNIKTPEVFVTYCDSDSNANANHTLNEPKNPFCNYVCTPVLRRKEKLNSCLINFREKEDLSIVYDDLSLYPVAKEDISNVCKPSSKNTGTDNTFESAEMCINKFSEGSAEEHSSPETIGSPFWAEENFMGILDSNERITIDDVIKSTFIWLNIDRPESADFSSHSLGSSENFIHDNGLSTELLCTMLQPEEPMKIDSPEEMLVPWDKC